jgi:hypothetical protein
LRRLALALCLLGCSDGEVAEDSDSVPRTGQSDGGTADGETTPVPDASDPNARPDDPLPTDEDCAPMTACGRACVRLASDPLNCGQCGRTCVIPNAEAKCVARTCVVGFCQLGFVDTDGESENGCEDEAEPGPHRDPDAGPPDGDDDTCNGVDEDGNGVCDDNVRGGCRHEIHRGAGPGHIYTDDLAEVGRAPFHLESQGYFYLYNEPGQGMRPTFLCQHPGGAGGFFLSSDTACGIGRAGRPIGFWSPTPQCGSIPLYHLVGGSDLFYTTSDAERASVLANLGYEDHGIAGHVWPRP